MIKAFKKLHQFYRGFDGAKESLEQIIGRDVCVSGCGKCCQVNTPRCMIIEAMNGISVLAGTGKLSKAVAVAEGWLLERHDEAPTYEGMPSGCFISSRLMAEYDALAALPCPFLAENKTCEIHEARPMVCRSYGVTRCAAGFCPRPPGKGETLSQLMYMNAPGLKKDIQNFKQVHAKDHPDWVIFGFLPAVIYRAAQEKKFREMVRDNRIASAKIIGTQVDNTLMWQVQADQLRAGVAGDLVVDMV